MTPPELQFYDTLLRVLFTLLLDTEEEEEQEPEEDLFKRHYISRCYKMRTTQN